MWKHFSLGYIRQNRASSISIIAGALISSLFLSLINSLFFNVRNYELQRDTAPVLPPLLMLYLAVLALTSLSLILIIHNSFGVSMSSRIRQLGILSSIGATPRQIRVCLIQEAAALCSLPLLAGILSGIALCRAVIFAVNLLAAEIPGRQEAVFAYHPAVFLATFLSAAITVLISAWLPARTLSRLTPLEAIMNRRELSLCRQSPFPLLSLLFGIEGKLAANALKAQKKALRTSTLSFTFAFLGFTLMLSFLTLSSISTEHTYFERYQEAWDVMVTVHGRNLEELEGILAEKKMPSQQESGQGEAENVILYQKAHALCILSQEDISGQLRELGGLEQLDGAASSQGESYQIPAPIVIMNDESFSQYCRQLGIKPDVSGTIVLNRIWDSLHSNFRYKEYIPFLQENVRSITLKNAEKPGQNVRLPALALTQNPPVLREEYDNYSLVQFIPLSLWKQIRGTIGVPEPDSYMRILAKGSPSLMELRTLEMEAAGALGPDVSATIENRIQEKLDNDRMFQGYRTFVAAFCSLLAIIGIANVFSNTLGFIHQRKREFARYSSLGMTPASFKKMFCIEAALVAGRPVLITLPLTALAVGLMIKASCLDPMEFLAKAPILPTALFYLSIFAFVGLAYYLGGKKFFKFPLVKQK